MRNGFAGWDFARGNFVSQVRVLPAVRRKVSRSC